MMYNHLSFKWVLICCMFIAINPLRAQINNSALSDEIKLETADSQCVGMVLNNFNYLRNTEYFDSIEPGRTLFGTQLHPQFYYQPHPRIRLQGGVFLQADFGETPVINKVLPTLTLKINNLKNTGGFIFGTLEGALAHRLIEPMFDINSAITNRIEYGAQFKINAPQLFIDAWINWENYIAPGYNEKEQFMAGINFLPTINVNKEGWQYQPTFQLTAFHRGGQIDTDTTNMLMVINTAAGVAIQKKSEVNKVKLVGFSGYLLFYKENSNSKIYYTKSGDGVYLNGFINFKRLGFMLSYWNGENYISPRGTAIYQSVGAFNSMAVEKVRQLLIGRVFYNHKIYNHVDLNVRFEPIKNLENKNLDYSFSVYLVYQLSKNLRLN